jgi:hypothetical protein
MWRQTQLAVSFLAFLVLISAQAQFGDLARPRSLGTVLGRINTGKWLEFQVTTAVNRTAVACLSGCSTSPSSSLPGSNSPVRVLDGCSRCSGSEDQLRNDIYLHESTSCSGNVFLIFCISHAFSTFLQWTYSTSGNCSQLTVIEGSGTGDIVYTIYDNKSVLGSTSQGTSGGTCGSDPSVCFADSKTGRGQFTLPAGEHSIVILVGSTTSTDATAIDRGWFQINTTSCSGNPIVSPTKAPASSTKAPAPASSTKAPTSSPGTPTLATAAPANTPTAPTKPTIPVEPTTNPSQCWRKFKCADVIIRGRKLCKCTDLLAGRKNCVNEQAKRVCCPRADRPADYKRIVVTKAKRICRL